VLRRDALGDLDVPDNAVPVSGDRYIPERTILHPG